MEESRLSGLEPEVVELMYAKITGGASGVHAWTRQRIGASGSRYDDPLTYTGIVSGVSSQTTTWMPARMPDGSTLSTFPVYGYVRPIGLTPATGPNFEILIAGGSSSARFLTFGLASTLTTTLTSMTSCTVYLYWGGSNPGTHVTIHNIAASATTTFIFSGTPGKRGIATYDDVNTKWQIIQIQC